MFMKMAFYFMGILIGASILLMIYDTIRSYHDLYESCKKDNNWQMGTFKKTYRVMYKILSKMDRRK